jgi:hypothetical protein
MLWKSQSRNGEKVNEPKFAEHEGVQHRMHYLPARHHEDRSPWCHEEPQKYAAKFPTQIAKKRRKGTEVKRRKMLHADIVVEQQSARSRRTQNGVPSSGHKMAKPLANSNVIGTNRPHLQSMAKGQ